jgi:hypothetical protein
MNMGYEAAGEDFDDLLESLDEDEKKNNGILSQKTKDLRQKVRDHLKNPR